jgi:archaellum biogenesis protein FlaJ (TadC family)
MSFSAKLEEVAVSGGMTTGVMPIRVQVPTIGQVYRFAKQIVSDEPLVVEVTYIKDTPFTIIKLMILLLVLYALYRRRNWLRKVWDSESDRYRKSVAKFITPLNLVIISALLFLFSSFFLHPFLGKLFFLILLVAVIYFGVHYLRARKEKEKKKKDIGTEIQR